MVLAQSPMSTLHIALPSTSLPVDHMGSGVSYWQPPCRHSYRSLKKTELHSPSLTTDPGRPDPGYQTMGKLITRQATLVGRGARKPAALAQRSPADSEPTRTGYQPHNSTLGPKGGPIKSPLMPNSPSWQSLLSSPRPG